MPVSKKYGLFFMVAVFANDAAKITASEGYTVVRAGSEAAKSLPGSITITEIKSQNNSNAGSMLKIIVDFTADQADRLEYASLYEYREGYDQSKVRELEAKVFLNLKTNLDGTGQIELCFRRQAVARYVLSLHCTALSTHEITYDIVLGSFVDSPEEKSKK